MKPITFSVEFIVLVPTYSILSSSFQVSDLEQRCAASEQHAQSLATHLRDATDSLAKLKTMVRAEKAHRANDAVAAKKALEVQVMYRTVDIFTIT